MILQQQKVQATVGSYRDLVAGIATGEEPNAGEVERLLADANKSVDDLRQDVEQYQHRMALKAMVASISKLEAHRCEINHEIAVADQALESAERQHDATTTPLYANRRPIDAALSDASRASAELVQTCDDAILRREVLELDAEARRLDEQCRQQRVRATYMEGKYRSERDRADHEAILSDAEARREVAERYHKEGEVARREVKRLERLRPKSKNAAPNSSHGCDRRRRPAFGWPGILHRADRPDEEVRPRIGL